MAWICTDNSTSRSIGGSDIFYNPSSDKPDKSNHNYKCKPDESNYESIDSDYKWSV